MSLSPREVAYSASFRAFANCYLREVDGGVWSDAISFRSRTNAPVDADAVHVVEVSLPSLRRALALSVRYRSRVGPHAFGRILSRSEEGRWRPIDELSAQLLLIDALYFARPESRERLELLERVLESHRTMTEYVASRLANEGPVSSRPPCPDFLEGERSTALGHWLHPTPKSRPGIAGWQHEHYAPELGGLFRLRFFAAARALVGQESLLGVPAERLSREIASFELTPVEERRLATLVGDDHCLLPVHPLQAEWLLHQPWVRDLLAAGALLDLGSLGPSFTATSSVRTVYSEDVPFMLKLSIPVKITNSLRINLRSELGDSVWVSRLLEKIDASTEFPDLVLLSDPAYLTLAVPGREETGFEVIFRKNPFLRGTDNGAPQRRGEGESVAALVREPLSPGAPSRLFEFVRTFAEARGLPLEEASVRWFETYFLRAIEPVLVLYDRHGIALEAHQQNSLLGFDPSGTPNRHYYRDIQGLALSETRRATLVALVPELDAQPKLFEPEEIVRNGLSYYLFFNHVFAIIHRLGRDGLAEEGRLLDITRRRLRDLWSSLGVLGRDLVSMLLEAETLPCKANLLTRLEDRDELESENELAVYTFVENPLATSNRAEAREIRPVERFSSG